MNLINLYGNLKSSFQHVKYIAQLCECVSYNSIFLIKIHKIKGYKFFYL